MEELSIILITTRRCNLRCAYCAVVKETSQMSREVFLRIADAIGEHRNTRPMHVKFFGGEPLLNIGEIKRFIVHLEKKKKKHGQHIRYSLTTNGALLTPRMLDWFSARGVSVALNLDGGARTYARARAGNSAALKRIHAHLVSLSEKQKRTILLNVVIRPHNADHLLDEITYLARRGYRLFNILPEVFAVWPKHSLLLLNKNLKKILRLARIDVPDMRIHNMKTENRLPFFNSGIVIDCNGDIYFNNAILWGEFSAHAGALKAGNIMSARSIEQVLDAYKKNTALQKNYGRIARRIVAMYHAHNKETDAAMRRFVSSLKRP